ncbi:MAG: O-antigen ligase family protein [Planctomycetia bacterium]|nr:O-antigen ligase family protein [Planctomycetia bacterium]
MSQYQNVLMVLGVLLLLAGLIGVALPGSSQWRIARFRNWALFAVLAMNLLPLGDVEAEGSIWRQAMWGGLFLVAGVHCLRDSDGLLSLPRGHVPLTLVLLVGYVLASTAWSPNAGVSLKRATQVVGVLLIAVALIRQSRQEDVLFQSLPAPALAFLVVGLVSMIFAPEVAFDSDGALRATTTHKNTWGQYSVLAAISVGGLALREKPRRSLCAFALALCVLSLLLSRSATSMVCMGVLACCAAFGLLVVCGGVPGRIGVLISILAGIVGLLGSTLATGDLPFASLEDSFYRFSGKTQVLTGRTYLWDCMIDEIRRHPLFGIGYGGFWAQAAENPSRDVTKWLHWSPGQAHNGYLDVVNELGMFGAALMFLVFAGHAARIASLWRRGTYAPAALHLAVLLGAVIINYAESSLLRTTNIWWIILCCSIVSVYNMCKVAPTEDPLKDDDERTTPAREVTPNSNSKCEVGVAHTCISPTSGLNAGFFGGDEHASSHDRRGPSNPAGSPSVRDNSPRCWMNGSL